MLTPDAIADSAHRLCEEKLIPRGISYAHQRDEHLLSGRLYSEALNDAGVDITADQLISTLIAMVGWDMEVNWPGHPTPAEVVTWLKEHGPTE